MSVIDLERTRNHIVKWLRDYAEKAGTKTWIVGLSGGIDSALTALLCKRTNINTVCVAMPCYSSDFSLKRALDFAGEFDLNIINVNLNTAYDEIVGQVHTYDFLKGGMNNPIATGGLRSCLRAPVLSFFALATKGLIVGLAIGVKIISSVITRSLVMDVLIFAQSRTCSRVKCMSYLLIWPE